MYSFKKLFHYTKYNLIDKWGFIYLEKSLKDSVFTMPKSDESIIVRIAKKKDILKITSDIFPYLTQEEIDHDGKYINRIGDNDFSCFIAEKDGIVVHYFLVYEKANKSPLIRTPFNNKLISDNDSYLGGAFTIPEARGMWIAPFTLSTILLYLRDSVKSKKVFVIVHKNTPGAEDFYKKIGFSRIISTMRA